MWGAGMAMKVAIRVDASAQMGLGHAMRCLALAQALQALGATCTFVSRSMPVGMAERIASLGMSLRMLPAREAPEGLTGYMAWLGVSLEQDADDTRACLEGLDTVDWLVVDHYAIDARWQTPLRAVARHIAVIDDLDDRPHDCDLLVDHTPSLVNTFRYGHHTPADCLRLLGPRYALLRPEFARARGKQPPERKHLKRILVNLGGTDPGGISGHALAVLAPLAFEGFMIDVVVGSLAPRRDALERAVASIPGATLHVDVVDMTQLYLAADLAVGAAGMAAWERCTLGLPTLMLTVADNQRAGAEALAELGGGIHLGTASAQHLLAVAGVARALAQSPDWLSIMSRSAAGLCDGNGAGRVAARMESFDMRLRRVVEGDSHNLWTWRNSEINNRYALDAGPISIESHQAWLADRLTDPDCILLVAEDDVGPVGVLRFDLDGERATVSIFLVPGRHGRGRGGVLLLAGERWLRANCPAVRELEAEILGVDRASLNVFAESGYSEFSRVFRKYLQENE